MKSANKRLIQKLEGELHEIRKSYKAEVQKCDSDFSLWLCDNYYLLERNCRAAVKSIKHSLHLPCDKNGLPRCYNTILDIMKDGIIPDKEFFIKRLDEPPLSASELFFLKTAVRSALITYCAVACKKTDVVILSNTIKSFTKLEDIDFGEIIEVCSYVEKALSSEKCGIYPKMEEKTRRIYREAVYKQSKKLGVSENEFALKIVEKANEKSCHVGEFLTLSKDRSTRGKVFLTLEVILPLIASVLLGIYLKSIVFPLLAYFPLWEIIKCFTDYFSQLKTPVSYLPRMEENSAVSPENKTMIVVSMLLPSAHKATSIRKSLEQLKKTNGTENVSICALCDLRSSDMPTRPEDEADISASVRVIEALNKKYDGGFILAVRKRRFSSTQNEYTGNERKRGAIEEIIKAVKGVSTDFICLKGDIADIKSFKYICALDSDTRLPMDAVSQLTEIASHPLNKAVVNEKTKTVESGYGIFAPYIGTSLLYSEPTLFSKTVGGVSGMSVYDLSAAERYQDLFSRGTFCGKGLIDIDAAFILLDGAFKKQHVLSHDILEGELLRAAYVSDVEFTDAAVSNPKAYFDRQHRWIRGDWQNIVYLKSNVKGEKEGRYINYDFLSKFKLFDNLRRSITPVFSALLLILSPLFSANTAWFMVMVSVLSIVMRGFFGALKAVFKNGAPMFSRRFYSDTFPVAKADLALSSLWFMLLMQNAYTCFTAIVTALTRLMSKKNLLQWTVASESEKSSKKASYLKMFLPSIIVGAIMAFTGNILVMAFGVFYIISPFISKRLGKEKSFEKETISSHSREMLISHAAAMWKYFSMLCGPSDNYLPPDNLQEAPVFRTAHRTSPTNIGLMLVSCLAARDLGFIDTAELAKRLDNTLTTVEKLDKYKGNLLNWYDTQTLKPLYPRYASTVDSGNFICSLVALRQGLLEYLPQCQELKPLIKRITAIIDNTDIATFFNEKRKLFTIGVDIETGEISQSYYDLFMSEARMTAYYAISARHVTKKLWGSLSRMLSSDGNYTGPLSWTGTMFEYFMPYLFIPSYRGTLSYEALRFCSRCQRRAVKKRDIPFGMSESCFYAFDNKLDYQYKAHGTQKLALKKGMSADTVISPYSTFLLLPFQPETAIKNLKKLEKYDTVGRFGFFEALDFTPDRTDGQDCCVVKSFMAHHIGMSLLSILNLLKDNILQKRFMQDEEMSAGEFLLHEKIQPGAAVFRDVYKKEIPQRSLRVTNGVYNADNITPLTPAVRAYSNSQWSLFISDCGSGFSMYNGLCVNKRSDDLLRRPDGVIANFSTGKTNIPFIRCADYQSKADFSAEFSGNNIKFTSKQGFIECSQNVSVFSRTSGEQRTFTVKNNSRNTINGTLRIFFEPSLSRAADELAHPAFSKIFIESYYDKENQIAVFCRRNRATGESVWLSAGFAMPTEYRAFFNREKVLDRPHGIFSLAKAEKTMPKDEGKSVDKCCYFEIPVKADAKQQFSVTMFIIGGSNKTEVTELALKTRRLRADRGDKFAPCLFSQSSLSGIISNSVLPYIFYGKDNSRERLNAVMKSSYQIDDLWKTGISGDNQIIYANVTKDDNITKLAPYIHLCKKLRKYSITVDVAIAYDEGGEYGSPMQEKLRMLLIECKALNEAGGLLHLLDLATLPEETDEMLRAAACYVVSLSAQQLKLPPRMYKPANVYPVKPISNEDNDFDEKGNYKINQTPELPWCHTLCNMSFGTLVSDKSLGYTYAINSSENPLTPWFNDTRTDNRGEILFAKYNGKIYDLAENASVTFGENFASYEGIIEELSYVMKVKVREKGMRKTITVNIKNSSELEKDITLLYYCEPVIPYTGNNKPVIKDDCLIVSNSLINKYSGFIALSIKDKADIYTTNKADVLSGNYTNSLSISEGVCAAVGKKMSIKPNKESETVFVFAFGKTADSAVKISSQIQDKRATENNKIVINTPDNNLNVFFNSLLKHQIIASRVYSRTGFYQSGGAFGYRDQLQDVCALILTDPLFCKRQIIRCCAVQFPEGDVLHWWHPLGKEGFRG
ncbi:MAG TPA: glucoamylase family protein, partial [Oscillospiraceae bacterium]|nr:glucoamylase family protein [Oscillospiraceae bacterium]